MGEPSNMGGTSRRARSALGSEEGDTRAKGKLLTPEHVMPGNKGDSYASISKKVVSVGVRAGG